MHSCPCRIKNAAHQLCETVAGKQKTKSNRKMKKIISLFLISFILITNSGKTQVAKIKNKLIIEDDIILLGPLNVDSYFPEQATPYILKYKDFLEKLKLLITDFEMELEHLANKRVKNPAKINQIKMAIEKFTLESELLNDFIFLWEEHDLNLNSYNDDFKQNFKETNCYSFIMGDDTLRSGEIEIVKIKPQKKMKYYEFIEGDYLEVVPKITKEDWAKAIEDSKSTVMIGNVPSDLVVCSSGYSMRTSNIQDRIESNRKFTGFIDRKFQEQILDVDDPKVVERMEELFSEFHFGTEEKEFYKERKNKDISSFFQIWLKETDKQIIPDNWFLADCK